MADWYYASNGQTVGPFTENELPEMIETGLLSEETLVWNGGDGNSDRVWARAGDTELAAYFKRTEARYVRLPEERPGRGCAEMPSDEIRGPLKLFAGKKLLLSLTVIVLVTAISALAYGSYVYFSKGGHVKPLTPEAALPASDDSETTFFLQLADADTLKAVVRVLSAVAPVFASKLGEGIRTDGFADALNVTGDFLDTVNEMAFFASPDQVVYYASFFADKDAFDSFVSKKAPLLGFERWDTELASGDDAAWVGPFSGAAPYIYVLIRPVDTRNLVLAAGSEGGIADMISAFEGKSPRFAVERKTSGDNLFQMKSKKGFSMSNFVDIFGLDDELASQLYGNLDKVLWSFTEHSWTSEGNRVDIESFSDLFEKSPEFISNRPKISNPPQILGEGRLVSFNAADIGFVLHCVFPSSADPVGELFKLSGAGTVPPAIAGDLRAILERSRLSVVCVANEKKLSTAYLLLESDAKESLDKLYALTGMFAPGGAALSGWDSASAIPIPLPGAPNIVIAHRTGAILAGVGDIASYGKSVSVPSEFKNFLSPDNVMNSVLSSEFMDTLIGMIDEGTAMRGDGASTREIDEMRASFAKIRDSFDTFRGNMQPSGKSYSEFVFTGKGDVAGLFEALLTPALMNRPRGSSVANAEAVKVINDLRNLKAASLMFFVDNNKWPESQKDAAALDKYMDRPFLSSSSGKEARYGLKFAFITKDGKKTTLLGFDLEEGSSSSSITPVVKTSLSSKAKVSNLLDEKGDIYSGGRLVFMIMY
ncbi:MAG: DUF4339 domain-containing protein [Synergistaceae bacterium]|jgi:hypothetical protein|nr:DUF4339 domain-containing protein [Synergistaceae bacterium]